MRFSLTFSFILAAFVVCISNNSFSQQKEYDLLKQEVEQKRISFAEKYNQAQDSLEKDKICTEVKSYLLDIMINRVFPSWYGTTWEITGLSSKPQQGTVNCGFFVTTTLKAIGFRIPSIKWSQLASETFIRRFTSPSTFKRFWNKEIEVFVDYIQEQDENLFIVGLDCH